MRSRNWSKWRVSSLLDAGAFDMRPYPEERALARVSKDGSNARTRIHPSRRGEDAAPQDEVGGCLVQDEAGDRFKASSASAILSEDLILRSVAKRCVSKDGCNRRTRGHPSRGGEDASPQDEAGDRFKASSASAILSEDLILRSVAKRRVSKDGCNVRTRGH